MAKAYFPQGLAAGQNFCNREAERGAPKKSIAVHEHIVLVAPRRYGKTSLIAQVLKENKSPHVHVDFFFVLKQEEIVRAITEAIEKLVATVLPTSKSAAGKLVCKVAALNPKMVFNILVYGVLITCQYYQR